MNQVIFFYVPLFMTNIFLLDLITIYINEIRYELAKLLGNGRLKKNYDKTFNSLGIGDTKGKLILQNNVVIDI